MATKRTFTEKLHASRPPEVKRLHVSFADMKEGEMMLIPSPAIVDEYIRQIPKGSAVDVRTMRKDLAMAHHAHNSCPLTTGIFLRIVAEAAYEQYLKGKPVKALTPFWRVIDLKMPIVRKLSFGPEFIRHQREREGLAV